MNYFKGKNKEFSFRDLIYKALIFIGTVGVIVYFLPRDGKFNYQFDIDKPWKYGQLMATFDFPIYKDDQVVKKEQDSILASFQPYFQLDKSTGKEALKKLKNDYQTHLRDILPSSAISKKYYPRCTGRASFPLKSLPGCTKTAHLPLW
jgi:hypothetical protein